MQNDKSQFIDFFFLYPPFAHDFSHKSRIIIIVILRSNYMGQVVPRKGKKCCVHSLLRFAYYKLNKFF